VQSPEDLHAPVVGRRLSAPEYRGSSAEEFFEKLLVFAFCHAAYGNWSLGRRFAEVALEAIDRSSKIKLKEARILIAVCRSKSFSHDAKHHEVMDFFDQIVSVDSNSVRSLLQRGDARLVVELGSLAMRFPKAWSDWTGSSVNVSVDELGERAVDRAEHSKSGDLGLRLSALNNLCFWYASQGDERCLQYWDRLANFVDDVSVKHIWREVQHTLLYCESEFGEGVTDEERATLRNRLKKLEAQLGE